MTAGGATVLPFSLEAHGLKLVRALNGSRIVDAPSEIKKLYYNATRATIARDLARAVELLKSLPDEDARQQVAVYMDGLSQMRSEWAGQQAPEKGQKAKALVKELRGITRWARRYTERA